MLFYDSLFCDFFLLLHFLDWFDSFCLFWGGFFFFLAGVRLVFSKKHHMAFEI